MPVRESVEDSALTKALQSEDMAFPPKWHHAITLSPDVRNSPHYKFHGAISQINELNLVWRIGEFTPAARRASARRLLELWQKGGSDDDGKLYLHALDQLIPVDDHTARIIDEKDLPK